MSEYRHEFKYMIDAYEEASILSKVEAVLRRDGNVSSDGMYIVRSLYFDDVNSSCLYENIDGTDRRFKYRIRYYNNESSCLRLEKKSKEHGMTKKDSCAISEEDFWLLYQGRGLEIQGDVAKRRLIVDFVSRGMRPKVIVTYERIPFIFSGGNVRVTFDRKLGASYQIDRFLLGDYRQGPVFDLGKSILEVKFDEFLPVHISDAIQTNRLRWTTFSKYYMCCLHGI